MSASCVREVSKPARLGPFSMSWTGTLMKGGVTMSFPQNVTIAALLTAGLSGPLLAKMTTFSRWMT